MKISSKYKYEYGNERESYCIVCLKKTGKCIWINIVERMQRNPITTSVPDPALSLSLFIPRKLGGQLLTIKVRLNLLSCPHRPHSIAHHLFFTCCLSWPRCVWDVSGKGDKKPPQKIESRNTFWKPVTFWHTFPLVVYTQLQIIFV